MTDVELASVIGGGRGRNAAMIGGATVAGGAIGWGIGWGIVKVRNWIGDTPQQRCYVAPPGSPISGLRLCGVE